MKKYNMNWLRQLLGLRGPHNKTNKNGRGTGRLNKRNPFRGLAVGHQTTDYSCLGGTHFRHVDGVRDTRHARPGTERPFVDTNPTPVLFSA